ncbi:unnamed protein product [Calicophoron daubneyi]|uniref:Kinesin motor domain-containing protein n=1 Tax=Calicophoron daubneyi TaxID=300641 RepID=A0AAV2TN21_CALDB
MVGSNISSSSGKNTLNRSSKTATYELSENTMQPTSFENPHETTRFVKRPPTAFVDTEDWGVYLRVCCQLRQIQTKYGCSDMEAQKLIFGARSTRRACIVRMIGAFNRLYAEYSKLMDVVQNQQLNCNTSHGRDATVESATPDSVDENVRVRNSVQDPSENTHNTRQIQPPNTPAHTLSSSSGQGDTGLCVVDVVAQPVKGVRSTENEEREKAIVKTRPDCAERTVFVEQASCLEPERTVIVDPSTSAGTMQNSTSTSLHMTPMRTSSSSRDVSQNSAYSRAMLAHPGGYACFGLCRKNFRKHYRHSRWDRKREAIELSKRLGRTSILIGGDRSDVPHQYYDQIRRKPAENSLVVYQVSSKQSIVEHRVQIRDNLISLPKHSSLTGYMELNFANDIMKSMRLPIALELIMPRMQKQIEDIMLKCEYIYDPLEVAAELRLTNYDTEACVAYFQRTRLLRDIIHEFLPESRNEKKYSGNLKQQNFTSASPSLQQPSDDRSSDPNTVSSSTIFNFLLELQSHLRILKKNQLDATKRLDKLRAFVTGTVADLAEELEDKIVAKICTSPSLEKIVFSQHKDLPFSQLNKLAQENRTLKATLRMEENRRKTVFNMMQEYLGNIRVYCRCRSIPLSIPCLEVRPIDTVILNYSPDGGTEQFKFDRVFDTNASQAEVYTELAPSVCSFLDGYNVCFLTYGGEASGKTYTLLGTEGGQTEQQGIAQRALRTVLSERDARQHDWDHQLTVAVVEIYNDSLNDLLGNEVGVHVRVDNGLEGMMEVLQSVRVENEADIETLLSLCRTRRKTGQTALNLLSSRSHLIILARLNSRSRIHETELCSVLALCDLAGFEDIIKADTLLNPTLAKEAGYINRSLTALNRVFMSLRTQDPTNVSYRDSKLTYLLKPFFTFSGKCILIVTVRTDRSNVASTQSTLRFGRESRGVSLGRARRQFNLDKLIDDMRAA